MILNYQPIKIGDVVKGKNNTEGWTVGCQTVLKIVGCKSFVGSNPISSAKQIVRWRNGRRVMGD